MRIKWLRDEGLNECVLSISQCRKYGSGQRYLRCGTFTTQVNLVFDSRVTADEIGLTAALKNRCALPDSIPYELIVTEHEIRLGPVIAFLVTSKSMTSVRMEKYKDYLWDYQNIKGLIYLFSLNDVQPGSKVEGYYYQPGNNGLEQASWNKGVFPYPDVIYRRIGVNRNASYDRLSASIQHKIFNPAYLNKWDIWNLLKKNPMIRPHLPDTRLLRNMNDLFIMLRNYQSVYIKPYKGAFGRGIAKIDQHGHLYHVRHQRMNGFFALEKLASILTRLIRKRSYLCQQSVCMKIGEKHVDFRVIMQKNEYQRWECTGIIARYGLKGKVTTNTISALVMGKKALKHMFGYSDAEAQKKIVEIELFCAAVCQTMDTLNCSYADLGFDVTVDSKQKIWLLEINFRQMHNVAAQFGPEKNLYRSVTSRPLQFAKSFAGF